jgi:predicted DNA-binding transcriptional regulator AlpA
MTCPDSKGIVMSKINATHSVIESPLFCIAEVEQYVKAKKSKIYELIEAKTFPHQIKIGRQSRWLREEIVEWLDLQIAAHKQTQANTQQ